MVRTERMCFLTRTVSSTVSNTPIITTWPFSSTHIFLTYGLNDLTIAFRTCRVRSKQVKQTDRVLPSCKASCTCGQLKHGKVKEILTNQILVFETTTDLLTKIAYTWTVWIIPPWVSRARDREE